MYTSFTDLEQALLHCTFCHLCREGNLGPTSYNGTIHTPLMVIGEGPGGMEDEYGVPLIGLSGQLLDKALWSVGVTRDRIYTTNIVKCRPKNNRTPTTEEGRYCARSWLDNEINIVKPQVIIALGSVALKYLYGDKGKITKDRGRWFDTKYGIPAIATFHPAYLLRLSGPELNKAKWEVFYDLKSAIDKCTIASPNYSLRSDGIIDLVSLYEQNKTKRRILAQKNTFLHDQ